MVFADTIIPRTHNYESTKVEVEGVSSLFTSTTHRISEERLRVVEGWVYHEKSFDGPLARPEVSGSRLNFLNNVWEDPHFRPFDDVQSSVKYFASHKDKDFLIRLSSTVPGSITLSFRKVPRSTEILHTRFTVNNNGNIVDSHKTEHTSIKSLANWFCYNKYRGSSVSAAGYVCSVPKSV